MMIEVKGTRSATTETPAAAQGYDFPKEQRRTRTPYAIAIALTGLFVYLRSIVEDWAQPFEPPFPPEKDDGDQPMPVETASLLHTAAEEAAATEEPEGPDHSGRPLMQFYVPASFQRLDSPEVSTFMQPETPIAWTGIPPVALAPVAANDNAGGAKSPPPAGGGSDATPAPGEDGGGPATDPPQEPGDDDDGEYPAANRAPRVSGPVYLMDVASCAVLLIGLFDLLRHAEDPDGDVLSVADISVSSGTIVQGESGWLYSAESRFTGEVTVSYRISDGEFAVSQTAHFRVLDRAVIAGGDGDDNLLGSMCGDDIDGGDGDDNIDARGGDDVIHGGAGNDHIVAGDGDDIVHAGPGDDIVFGGNGNDVIYGGAGDDRLFGDAGDDILFGEEGDDYLSGGDGDDILYGGDGDDILHGDAGDDVVYGGDGDDILHDGDGEDIVTGGAGDDRIVASLDGDADIFDGGEGHDTLDYSAATESLTIDLAGGQATGAEIGQDTITGFEAVMGGGGDDHFIVGHLAVTLTGGDGDDLFEFTGPPPSDPLPEPMRFEITDFRAGDRVRMSKYDLFEKVFDRLEDEFERIYGDDVDDDDVRIKYRHENEEGRERTIIEADFNRDYAYETTITLEGRHLLVIVEHA